MPASFKHTVERLTFGQKTHEQCWFASYQMMFKFLKRPTSEVESKLRPALGTRQDDSGQVISKFDEALKLGLSDTDYKMAADALGLKNSPGTPFKQKPAWYDIGLSDGCEAFLEILKNGPLWVSIRVSSTTDHAVVAVGYDDDATKIVFNNPFPGPSDAIEDSKDANTFMQLIKAANGAVAGIK